MQKSVGGKMQREESKRRKLQFPRQDWSCNCWERDFLTMLVLVDLMMILIMLVLVSRSAGCADTMGVKCSGGRAIRGLARC